MIVDIVRECIQPVAIEEGTVKSINPLEVGLANDKRMILTDKDIIVPARFGGNLQEGEKLYLLTTNGGKRYYILDREGG